MSDVWKVLNGSGDAQNQAMPISKGGSAKNAETLAEERRATSFFQGEQEP